MKTNKTLQSVKGIFFLIMAGLSIASCKKENNSSAQPNEPVEYHQTAKTQFVTAGGNSYAYRVLGDKAGVPLVMISPLGGGMDDWDPAVTNGLAQQFKVILFDNRGVGVSKGITPDNIADMAGHATEFIKALGYSKVNLMGFSMGSFITQQILLTSPELVDKVIITGAGPKGAVGLANLPDVLGLTAGLNAEQAFVKLGFANTSKSIDAGKAAYARIQKRTADRDLPLSDAASAAQLTAVLKWAQPDANALTALKSVKNPVFIAHGQDDIPVNVVNAVNLSKSFPNVKLTIFPESGHAAVFQNYPEFVKQAIEFLNK